MTRRDDPPGYTGLAWLTENPRGAGHLSRRHLVDQTALMVTADQAALALARLPVGDRLGPAGTATVVTVLAGLRTLCRVVVPPYAVAALPGGAEWFGDTATDCRRCWTRLARQEETRAAERRP